MAEEQPTAEMAEQDTETVEGSQPINRTDSPITLEALQAEQERTAAALKKANAEAAKYRKQVEALAAEDQKRKDAELTEMEKLQKQLADAQAQAQRLQRETLQRKIAAELNLPEPLALRLQGNDEEEMKADAEAILAAMPKPTAPKVNPTNPANGQPPGETVEQRRRRIYSGGQVHSGSFDPVEAAKRGGGVVWPKGE